jgi:hypothetical protein
MLQQVERALMILIVKGDRRARVSAHEHVMNGACKIHSRSPRHSPKLAHAPEAACAALRHLCANPGATQELSHAYKGV